MSNFLELRIRSFLEQANQAPVAVSEEILKEFVDSCRDALQRQFSEGPRKFGMRLSNLGKPLCQLQMQKAGTPAEPDPYNHKIRMLLGNMSEAIMVAVMRLAGIPLEAVQEHVTLKLPYGDVNGTLDVEIDGAVWDVKSASGWAYNQKFKKGYKGVAENDSFGYVVQGYGYADARKKPFGGWIVLNKETGEIAVTEADPDPAEHRRAMATANTNLTAIGEGKAFQRCFEDEPETFRSKPTGNRVLKKPCEMCSYKFTCWPTLKLAASQASEAKFPPMRFYTDLKEKA